MVMKVGDLEVILDDVREDIRRIKELGAAAHRLAMLAVGSPRYQMDAEYHQAVDSVLAYYGKREE